MNPGFRRFAWHAIKDCGWLAIAIVFLRHGHPTTLEITLAASLWMGLYGFVQVGKCFAAYSVAYRETLYRDTLRRAARM
jgi:hypothetical protein